MVQDPVILILSLAILAKFSNITIKNAVKFSQLSGINQLTVGFIVLAVSTSLPELVIAIISSSEKSGYIKCRKCIWSKYC